MHFNEFYIHHSYVHTTFTSWLVWLWSLTGSLCVCSCLARSDELENFLVQLNSAANLQLNGFWRSVRTQVKTKWQPERWCIWVGLAWKCWNIIGLFYIYVVILYRYVVVLLYTYVLVIWNIMRSFGIFCCHLVHVFYGNLAYSVGIWYILWWFDTCILW
jgi:hypothetical protein